MTLTLNHLPGGQADFGVPDGSARRCRNRSRINKRDMISMLTHDMRTPLSTLKCSLATIADQLGTIPVDIKHELELMNRNTEHLLNLINRVLDLEKLDRCRELLSIDEIPLSPILARSVQLVEKLAEEKNISITIVGPGTCLDVDVDDVWFENVIVNLLTNAIKFSPIGSHVAITVDGSEEGWVKIKITDEGPGVAIDERKRLFHRFQKIAQSQDSTIPSTGLGLYMCKSIIDAHGGRIGVDCKPGAGSCFWVAVKQSKD